MSPKKATIWAAGANTTIHFIVRADLDAPVATDKIQITATPKTGEAQTHTFSVHVKPRR